MARSPVARLFFFNDTATTEIYTLSLHDALPIWPSVATACVFSTKKCRNSSPSAPADRKSTRLNSSHQINSYAVFGLKKKKQGLTNHEAGIVERGPNALQGHPQPH